MDTRACAAAVALLFAAGAVVAEGPQPREDAEAAIAHLLDVVRRSDCTFIRNGVPYAGAKASAHMERKYRYYREQIVTPEEFIRLAATKSIQSGRFYTVRTKAEAESRSDEWMLKALADYRLHGKDATAASGGR